MLHDESSFFESNGKDILYHESWSQKLQCEYMFKNDTLKLSMSGNRTRKDTSYMEILNDDLIHFDIGEYKPSKNHIYTNGSKWQILKTSLLSMIMLNQKILCSFSQILLLNFREDSKEK